MTMVVHDHRSQIEEQQVPGEDYNYDQQRDDIMMRWMEISRFLYPPNIESTKKL